MEQAADATLTGLKQQVQARAGQTARRAEAGAALSEAQCKLRAIELCLEELRRETATLEGFNLTALFYGVMGRKQARLADVRAAVAELEQRHAECGETEAALRSEMERLDRSLEQGADASREYEQLLARKQADIHRSGDARAARLREIGEAFQAAEAGARLIEKTIAACDESLADLRGECEVACKIKRSTVTDAKQLKFLMNASRRHTAGECAARVQQSLRRFGRRLEELRGRAAAGPCCDELKRLDERLGRFADGFAKEWFERSGADCDSADAVEQALASARMVLERLGADARRDVEALEQSRRGVIEGGIA
jgi:chromosome segregation ATPase